MHFSPPKLHPPVVTTDEHRNLVRDKIEALASRRPKSDGRVADGSRVIIPLTTVAMSGTFDSYIQVQFPIPSGGPVTFQLLVDSGNTCMIVPHAEALETSLYKDWGAFTEPFGCPARLLQGPLQIPTLDGSVYEIEDCVFYACYADNSWNPSLGRTANFGAGRVIPWPTTMAGVPPQTELTLACPFAYNTAYSFVEFIYGPAAAMSFGGGPLVTDGSFLVLNTYMPSGYTMMEIIPDIGGMAVVPSSLTIDGTLTGWPGGPGAIALVDTGGGPVIVSDPGGKVYPKPWPNPVTCPSWTSGSQNCNCINDPLRLSFVGHGNVGAYNYSIDTSGMPAPVQGLTAVACQGTGYLPGTNSMNIGGISMLFNRLLVEYEGTRIGLAPHPASWPPTIEMSPSVNQPVAVSPSGVLLGYDTFNSGLLTTTMTVSWSGLPVGATIRIKHDGSDNTQIVSWTGPDRSTQASGNLTATFMINRNQGAAVPVYIYVFGYEYLPLNIQLIATTKLG